MESNVVVEIAMSVLTLLMGVLTGTLRGMKIDNEKTAKDLAEHRLMIASQYATRADVREMEVRIERRFDKLQDWLDKRFPVQAVITHVDKE